MQKKERIGHYRMVLPILRAKITGLIFLLFLTYLVLFSWLVTRVRFFRESGISKPVLVALFLLKVVAAVFYGWMGVYYSGTAQMIDTWHFHEQAGIEFEILKTNPAEYFSNLFVSRYSEGYRGFFASSDSYWNDLKSNVFIKFLSILHIFSFGNYYINLIFYSFLSFFGPIAFFRVISEQFPGKKTWLIVGTFLVPSFLYWCSGLHKEGFLFLGVSLVLYHSYQLLHTPGWRARSIAGILLGLLLLFLLRNFLVVVIVPALVAWVLAARFPRKSLQVFFLVYTVFILLFFNLRYINDQLDLPAIVVSKQQAFLKLKGHSSIAISELEPNAWSFLINTPQAISLSTIRPLPSDVRHLPSLFAAIETLLLLTILLASVFFRHQRPRPPHPVLLFILFFAVSLLLVIGFSVNNLGAIARYRSIIIPFLLAPALAVIDWRKILSWKV